MLVCLIFDYCMILGLHVQHFFSSPNIQIIFVLTRIRKGDQKQKSAFVCIIFILTGITKSRPGVRLQKKLYLGVGCMYKYIFSNLHLSPNFWHDIFNTNIYIQKLFILGRTETLQLTFSPQPGGQWPAGEVQRSIL